MLEKGDRVVVNGKKGTVVGFYRADGGSAVYIHFDGDPTNVAIGVLEKRVMPIFEI